MSNVWYRYTVRLRSAEWFEGRDELGPQNWAVLRTLGWTTEFFAGKPVIAVANSWSEFNNCNLGLRLFPLDDDVSFEPEVVLFQRSLATRSFV